MTPAAWMALLQRFSQDLITHYADHLPGSLPWTLTPDRQASGWLGYAGATPPEIAAAETRLGCLLPPSYRAFLQVSNGWPAIDWSELALCSTTAIAPFAEQYPDWVAAWAPAPDDPSPTVPDDLYAVYGAAQDPVHLRREYLPTALAISTPSNDGDIFLLIQARVGPDGEWEAWHFGNKLPGANRYRSFYELMQTVVAQGGFIQ